LFCGIGEKNSLNRASLAHLDYFDHAIVSEYFVEPVSIGPGSAMAVTERPACEHGNSKA